MKNRSDHESLLEDIFSSGADGDFKNEAWTLLTAGVRRRARRQRWTRRVSAIAAVCAGLAVVWNVIRPGPEPQWQEKSPPAWVVRSAPLLTSQRVLTGPTRFGVVWTQPGSTLVVRTDVAAAPVQLIDDQELLSLFPDQAVALVRYDRDRVELIFAEDSPAPDVK